MKKTCLECEARMDDKELHSSLEKYNAALCRDHLEWLESSESTPSAISLYLELKKNGVSAELEKFDGHKTIDIAIPEHKLNIEVDGSKHQTNADQAFADLQRTYYSFAKGYFTLRIPNSLIENKIYETVSYIVKFLEAGKERNWAGNW